MIRIFLLVLISVSACFTVVHAQNSIDIGALFRSELNADGQHVEGVNYVCNEELSGGRSYSALLEVSGSFTYFGVGFSTDYVLPRFAAISVQWRSKKGDVWSMWQHAAVEFGPDEVRDGTYRTNALFTTDATPHETLELVMYFPVGIKGIVINMYNGGASSFEYAVTQVEGSGCFAFPNYIARDDWCGGSAACSQVMAEYTPTYITPTHTVVHHGASPLSYTNGAAVVQSYYNYHVNALGWLDIGYNYLIDHFGTIYQGRRNPQLPTADVRAAHAGASNDGSIGICFLGDSDAWPATAEQLGALDSLLGWWYAHRGIDPLSSESIVTQSYGTQVLPRIIGHRDLNPTACPGDNVYQELPAIRTSVGALVDWIESGCLTDDLCSSSCGFGTYWDADVSMCLADGSLFCGSGTVWDAELSSCVAVENTCLSDLNGDALVNVTDVLMVLSEFGHTCE